MHAPRLPLPTKCSGIDKITSKKHLSMKNIKLIISLSFLLLFVSISCDDDDPVQYGTEAYQKVTDAFIQVITPVISFQAGVRSSERIEAGYRCRSIFNFHGCCYWRTIQ